MPTPTSGLVRVPGWESYPWLVAAFSTRQGGGSQAYGADEQNLGWTLDTEEAATSNNRLRFASAVAHGSSMELVTVRQVHADTICLVEADHEPFSTANGRAALTGDALMTNLPGYLLGVQTADCVPVLIADTKNRVVAAFHAGWRGTLAGIVAKGISTMQQSYGSDPADLIAAIGPAIGPCCFAIGPEVREQFESRYTYAPALFNLVEDQLYMDLFEANRRQLLAAGVPDTGITVIGECSACTRLPNGRRKYFSHRAEQGFTGRMLSVIGIVPLT